MTKKYVVIGTILVFITASVVGFVVWQNNKDGSSGSKIARKSGNYINYEPATDEQKNAAGIPDENKDSDSGNSQNSNESRASLTRVPVDVLITTWVQTDDKIKVNGYVANIVERGGICTLTLEKDDDTVSASRPAEPNAQNTTCGQSVIAANKLTSGTWQATLSYSSDKYTGKSEPIPIDVKNE